MMENLARGQAEHDRQKRRQQHAEDLKTFDSSELVKMSSVRLAEWQSDYEQDEAQWVLADQEWKRRSGVSTRRIALAAIVVSTLSLLVASLGYFYPKNIPTAKAIESFVQPATKSKLSTQQLPENPVLTSRNLYESNSLNQQSLPQTNHVQSQAATAR
jgi:hypothetical protein